MNQFLQKKNILIADFKLLFAMELFLLNHHNTKAYCKILCSLCWQKKNIVLIQSRICLVSFNTRTVEDFSINTQMKYSNMYAKTSVGKAFELPSHFKSLASIIANNYENQIFLTSLPHTIIKSIRICNASLVTKKTLKVLTIISLDICY